MAGANLGPSRVQGVVLYSVSLLMWPTNRVKSGEVEDVPETPFETNDSAKPDNRTCRYADVLAQYIYKQLRSV